MNANRFTLLIVSLLLCMVAGQAQEEHGMGLVDDEEAYARVPAKVELLTRSYAQMPSLHSLLTHCPYARNQRQYSTCTAWATTYAARTIAEAVANGWTDRNQITQEAFSPLFVYAQIKGSGDSNCQSGTSISDALNLLKNVGTVKFNDFDVLCASHVGSGALSEAAAHRIDDYFTLFGSSCQSEDEKVRKTRKALSEDCPVVVSMECYRSLNDAGESWDGWADYRRGSHAMCVVGYDDERNGGSFLLMNSWGREWGKDGFTWVTYHDYARHSRWAFEMYVEPHTPLQGSGRNRMSGEVSLQLSTGELMTPVWDGSKGCYRIADSYVSGTRYRIYISNNEPAYVYVIGSDLGNHVGRVFPPSDHISAALTYKSNRIAIPDETYYVEMDDTQGTDYVCILYSKDPLDINGIVAQVRSTSGSFRQKVAHALSGKTALPDEVSFKRGTISFVARTDRPLVPVIVEVGHR